MNWKGKEITEKEFKSCLFQWRIPKNIRHEIMKEMEKIGLLKIEKHIVHMNNFYFKEIKRKEDYKDGDTKIESPYIVL